MSPCLRIAWKGSREQAAQVATVLEAGGLVAFPTDTVWGVGTLATSAQGCAALYALKGRPRDQALPCLVPSVEAAVGLLDRPPSSLVDLLRRHWPGALTVVGPARPGFLPDVRAGGPTIGLRMPDCRPLLDLLAVLPAPLASSSANLSGRPPLASAAQVASTLGASLAAILEWDQVLSGKASTVVAFEGDSLTLLRRGDVAADLLEAIDHAG